MIAQARRADDPQPSGRVQKRKDRLGELSAEQREALEDAFYTEFKGSVGVRELWEFFNTASTLDGIISWRFLAIGP